MNIEEKEMWVVDTDPGCDDMMCLIYMLNRRDIDLKMISLCEGNTTMENVQINMRKIMKVCNRKDVPIYKGGSPIVKNCGHAHHVHANDGLGELEELVAMKYDEIPISEGNSAVRLVELINQHPGKVNVMMIGPVTNLALAFMLDPNIVNLVKSVYTMGGAIHSRGNVSTCAEFNYNYDYLSTNIVFSNFNKIILVPWEPIERTPITVEDFKLLKENVLKCTESGKSKGGFGSTSHHSDLILNEKSMLYTEQLVEKFSLKYGGFKMCDLYCAICFFNKKAVKSCFIGSCDFIVDSEAVSGGTMLTKKKKMNSFAEALEEYEKVCRPGLQLIVDDLDKEIVLEEIKNIFYY